VGATIFSDEFSTQAGRWDHALTAKSKVGYLNGAYQMVIREGKQFATASPHVPSVNCLGDVRVSVDATLAVAHGQNAFGVACRTNGGTNSYYLIISSTGNYAIEKSVNGTKTDLANSSDPRILKGRSTNHIEALCQNHGGGVQLALSVNGALLFSALDKSDDLLSGTVGLVEISNTPGLDVRYDNFTVNQAPSA